MRRKKVAEHYNRKIQKMTSSTETAGTGTKRAEIKEQYKKFIGRKILFILFSLILIFIIAGIAATLGSYPNHRHRGIFNNMAWSI